MPDRTAPQIMSQFEDRFWSSRDGLRLHYREYPASSSAPAARPPVICLPGLTRNARDFEVVAERLAGEWRVLCPDMRGRGDSAYARDSATYVPMQYVDDLRVLLEEAGIERFVAIGTSLGGIMTMLLGLTAPGLLAGAVLNDIGPVIELAGLERIKDYVGQGRSYPTWMHAARALEETQSVVFPRFEIADWLRIAKRVMTLGQNGRIVFDYDMNIAEPFAEPASLKPIDLWPAFDALEGVPLLSLRGALSDLFSAETMAEMARRRPDAEMVTVPDVGHAPTLDEPEAVAAIARLLARIA